MDNNHAFQSSKFLRALLVLFFMTVSVQWTFAQLDLNMSRTTLGTVIEQIKTQSKYQFFYDDKLAATAVEKVNVKNASIEDALTAILKGKNISFKVEDNIVYLSEKSQSGQEGAQQGKERTITGQVSDDMGPLIGVNVLVKGTSVGCITDFDGNFVLRNVADNAILQISFVGYQTSDVSVKGQNNIKVVLSEDTETLDEVVVVGYGTMKKSDLTGSVTNVKAEKLLSKPVVNVGQALAGKASGVEIFENGGTPDGKVRVRIRGNNSINSSNEPLYVVDGVIGVSNINLLNPSEIESLEVLKDASATAIYGARGANGVIMITTKRGIKNEKAQISYDGYVSIGKMAKKLDLMNASEWWQNYNTTMDNGQKYDPEGYAQGKYKKVTPADLPNLFDANGNPLYDTDWQDEAYQTAINHNHQVSIRGGADKTLYSVHLGYMHKDALMRNGFLDRYSGRINLDSQLRDWLKMGANMSFNYNKGNDNYKSYGVKRLVQEAIPLIPVKYPDGSWGTVISPVRYRIHLPGIWKRW